MSCVLSNKDLTEFNGIELKGEIEHQIKLTKGIWQGVYYGIAFKEELNKIFSIKPKTLIVINQFFEGEFDYSLRIISEMNDAVRFRLILKEKDLI